MEANGLIELGAASAILYKIQTLVDGGARITLDLGSHNVELISKLIEYKMRGDDYFQVGFVRGGE